MWRRGHEHRLARYANADGLVAADGVRITAAEDAWINAGGVEPDTGLGLGTSVSLGTRTRVWNAASGGDFREYGA